MKKITEQIRDGLRLSSDPKVIEIAKKFMSDNGFKKNPQGKLMATNCVRDWAEKREVSAELSTAIQGAIITL